MASNRDHDESQCTDRISKQWIDPVTRKKRICPAYRITNRLMLYWPLAIAAMTCVGCNSLVDSRVPELIQQRVDPQLGRSYLLYRPSGYDNKRSWPLIVVCHSSFTDSPNRQIRRWTELAESKGFLVVAPTLKSVSSGLGRGADAWLARIQNDEDHILAVVQHVRAGHNVSDDRILMAGQGKGGLVALHVGLRQPNVFRAITVTQPTYDARFLTPAAPWIDHHQPVRVHYTAKSGLWTDQSAECVDWLRRHGADVRADMLGASQQTNTALAVQFFERVIREEPWIRIEPQQAPDHGTLARKFILHSTIAIKTVRWTFGDGDESLVNNPLHVYKVSGRYRVTATLKNKKNVLVRTLDVTVP